MKIRIKSLFLHRLLRFLSGNFFRLAENNENTNHLKNGEKWLLTQVLKNHADKKSKISFGGANIGKYTELALKLAQQQKCLIEIHAFEPSSYNQIQLKKKFDGNLQVKIVENALGEESGEATFYESQPGDTMASLIHRKNKNLDYSENKLIRVCRLDDYINSEKIKHINLLKLDIEGFEFTALKGLGDKLQPSLIDMIQFEYGGTFIDAGITLRQIYELLTSRGYHIGKLYPNSLEIRKYRDWMENYQYANYVALAPHWVENFFGKKNLP
jgi:FkbM family methyltransferase